MSAPKPRVDLDATRERLARLGLVHAADQLGDRVTAVIKDSVSPHRVVDELLDAELGAREERRVRTSLRLSGLPLGQTLGNFDFSFQPSVDRARDWPEVLAGDEILATAILDRLLHRSHVLNIRGRSYRLRDLEQAAERTA